MNSYQEEPIQFGLESGLLGVITRPMGGYQLPEWIRITVGTPDQNARCIAGLKKVLASIR